MTSVQSPPNAHEEKNAAALSSLGAAVLLTTFKLVVGISTNSLGILSEAAHSAFDLLAAGVTVFAVKYAAFPADRGHPYGHGKIENLSALVESLLLLVTCVWIIWEAVDRLFFTTVHVSPSFWALGVMVVSIVVDYSRSRMLLRIAKKHNSQALEADALHFSTDIWSSAVVIVGLAALYAASLLPQDSVWRPWLERADALAALGVSGIVIHVSVTLAKQAVNILLDAGDMQLADTISAKVLQLPEIRNIQRLRLRHSGPSAFADMAVEVDGNLLLEDMARIRREVASLVQEIAPGIDITLEALPAHSGPQDMLTKVRSLAALQGLDIHALEFLQLESRNARQSDNLLQLHVEIEPTATLGEAHAVVSDFERRVQQEVADTDIVSHIEPKGEYYGKGRLLQGEELQQAELAIRRIVEAESGVYNGHSILVRSYGDGQAISFHCCMNAQTPVLAAHKASLRVQSLVQQQLPEAKMVLVHMEPLDETPTPPPA